MQVKVLTINPPATDGIDVVREGRCMQRKGAWTSVWPPISLSLIAAVLERENFQVKLYDCIAQKINWPSLAEIIKKEKPFLLICNTATPSIQSDLSLALLAKEIIPTIKTAFFGIHVSALSDECFTMQPEVDFIIRGEPEMTTKQLVCYLRDGSKIDEVDGISYKSNGKVKHNKDRKPIENLDELPYPSWHLVDIGCYPMPLSGEPFLMVATSRGCPHKCIFCAAKEYYGASLRLRNPKSVADEMVWALDNFGVDQFLFWSESFTLSKKFVKGVCDEIIATGKRFRWVCNSRTDSVNRELLSLMKEAGCWMIGYGIESGNQEILEMVGKSTTVKQAENAVTWAKEVGLEVTGHLIVGLPGEDEKTINETIQFAKQLKLDYAQFYCAVPFPGSRLYSIAKNNGWINTNDWRMFEQNYSVLDTEKISASKIMELRRKAYKNFYIRPKILFQSLKKVPSIKKLVNLPRETFDLISWVKDSQKENYKCDNQKKSLLTKI